MKPNRAKNIYLDHHIEPLRGTENEFKGRIVKNKRLSIDHPQIKQQKFESAQKQPKYKNPSNQELKNPQKIDYSSKKTSENLFTQTYRKKLEIRLFEIEQRKKQLNARSLQKQMAARLNRKINERLNLQQKIDLMKDLQEQRELMLAERKHEQKRMRQQQQLLHESNLINVEMFRKNRAKSQKKQLKQSKYAQKQSWHNLKFKDYLSTKEKEEVRWMITSHLEFRSNKSQSKMGKVFSSRKHRLSLKKIQRPIKTSQKERIDAQNNEKEQIFESQKNEDERRADQFEVQSNTYIRVSNQTQPNSIKKGEKQMQAQKIPMNMK